MKRHQAILGVMLGLCLTSSIAAGQARAYTFTKIADTSDGYSSFGRGLSEGRWPVGIPNDHHEPRFNQHGISINWHGEVAFVGNLDASGQAILTGDGNNLNTIAETGFLFNSFGQGLSINADGTVAFFASPAGTTGHQSIYTSTGGDPDNIAFGTGFAPGLSINNSGTVAYYQGGDIYTNDGTNVVNITGCRGLIHPPPGCRIVPQRPSINNEGTVVYATHHGIQGSNNEIFTDTQTFPAGWFMDPSISHLGQVVFHSHFYGRGRGIFTSDGDGENNFIAGSTIPFTWVTSPSINMGGTVAFLADLPTGSRGIYTGHDVAAEVISTGDFINGSIVTDISLDRESLNNQGQIAFWAKLLDGTEGIFRADPEPGESQFNPLLPDFNTGSLYQFRNEHRYQWFDPPSAYGFKFEMVSDSLFTSILNFPLGFDNPFTVLVGDEVVGEYGPGDSVDFASLFDGGVSEFTVTGLDVDPSDPTVFPIQLDFNTDTASFDMIALFNEEDPNDPASVPEPSGVLSLLIFGFGAWRFRKQQ